MVTFIVAMAVDAIQAKYKGEMLFQQKMIEKSLLLRKSPSMTPLLDPNVSLKSYPTTDLLPKNTTERWNQAALSYFDPHFNKAYGKSEIVLVGKDVYYKNVVLFV